MPLRLTKTESSSCSVPVLQTQNTRPQCSYGVCRDYGSGGGGGGGGGALVDGIEQQLS